MKKRHFVYLLRWDLLLKKIIELYNKNARKYKENKSKKAIEDESYWKSMKDKYKNQAGFVICNGPSLNVEDLTKIHKKGFLSIASNKIFMIFDQTPWRPTIFTIADNLVWENHSENIHPDIKVVHSPSRYVLNDDSKEHRVWKSLPCISMKRILKSFKDKYIDKKYIKGLKHGISDDMTQGAYGGCTVTYNNIQIATHLGFNPIYLIGCDHFYSNSTEDKKDSMQSVDTNAHFVKGYLKPGEKVNPAPIKCMTEAYEDARLYCETKNIRIFNATRGGYLEVFERVDLDEILENKKVGDS